MLRDEAVVQTQACEIAKRVEQHEAAVWAACAMAASSLPGDPLRVTIDRSGPTPLVAMRAVDRRDLNRVVALGVRTPARPEDLDAVCSFYASNEQHFRIEVSPLAQPSDLASLVAARGLTRDATGTFKIWRPVEHPLLAPQEVDVKRLDSTHTDAIATLSVVAWGAWSTPVLRSWFGAMVGRPGVQHYGVFDQDRLVATGALFVSDRLGWFGFDATHPRYQARTLRQSISALRLHDARAQGCEFVHAESAIRPRPRAFRDGWQLLYEKQNYSTT